MTKSFALGLRGEWSELWMIDSACYRQLAVRGGEFLHTGRLIRIDCGPVGPKRESSPLVDCSRCHKLEKPLAERRNPKRSPTAVL